MSLPRVLRSIFVPSPLPEGNDPAGCSAQRANLLFALALLGVAIIGIALRAGYLSRPYYQCDEAVTNAVAAGLDYPWRWTTNWIAYPVPPEFHYDEFNFSSYHYLAHGWLTVAERLVSPDHQLTILRALNLPLALASLLFTALAVRRSFGWRPGVFAAAVAAVLPILVQDAHYARCDTMLTAGVASVIWLVAPRADRQNWHWGLAGAVVGWLVASKFSLVLLSPFLLGAAFAEGAARSSGWAEAARRCGWLVLGGSLGIALGMPGAFTDFPAFLRGVRTLLAYYDGFHPPYSLPDHGPVMGSLIAYLWIIIGPGILTAAGLGAIHAWRRTSRPWVAGLVLTLALSVLIFGSQSFIAERNVSPFLPLLAVLAGSGLAWLLARGQTLPGAAGRMAPWLATIAALLALVAPLRLSLRMVTRGFSLNEYHAQLAWVDRVAAENTRQQFIFCREGLTNAESFAAAEKVLRAGPAVFAIYDPQDANSHEFISRLLRDFGGRVLAKREGLFPELPCCTLTTMVSTRLYIIQCSTGKP